MGRRGRAFALRFDPATIAQEYKSLYEEILGRKV